MEADVIVVFVFDVAGHYPKETHPMNNDITPLFINRKLKEVSKINKKGYKIEIICLRLVSSLLPIGNQDENGEWQNLQVFHYMELKVALARGFVIDYLEETLWFDQSPILKDFCDKVQAWRRESNTEFEKSFYKLILNSLYGRMLMNTRKFCDSYLVSDTYTYPKDETKQSNKMSWKNIR